MMAIIHEVMFTKRAIQYLPKQWSNKKLDLALRQFSAQQYKYGEYFPELSVIRFSRKMALEAHKK